MLNLSDRRELMIDDLLTDRVRTDAPHILHQPQRREIVMTNNQPWEGDGWAFYTAFRDGSLVRMYYLTMQMFNAEHTAHKPPHIHICYAESTDGIHFEKPDLGICEFQGNKHNNILLSLLTGEGADVFIDTNPQCPPAEKYKMTYIHWGEHGRELWLRHSADGIHFGGDRLLIAGERFDSHNILFYDANLKKYACYLRGGHKVNGEIIRDIRRALSEDSHSFSAIEPLIYDDNYDTMQMYTNNILPYFRAPHIYIGVPARYQDHSGWSPNYDQLCGCDLRKERMKVDPRYGLATTDGILMTSRDGLHFHRTPEAFLRPSAENPLNWTYGNGYASHGFVPTKGLFEGEDSELSLYTTVGNWTFSPVRVVRNTLRTDGFFSRNGDYCGKHYVTKPFLFDGTQLDINFSTAGTGYITLSLEDEQGQALPGYHSGILFGDSIDRRVAFEKSPGELIGKPIRLHVFLKDADFYAFRFHH